MSSAAAAAMAARRARDKQKKALIDQTKTLTSLEISAEDKESLLQTLAESSSMTFMVDLVTGFILLNFFS